MKGTTTNQMSPEAFLGRVSCVYEPAMGHSNDDKRRSNHNPHQHHNGRNGNAMMATKNNTTSHKVRPLAIKHNN